VLTNSVERTEPDFVDANGIRLCYESFGKRGDPALVLIMGLGAQMVVWPDDFCAQLAAQGRWVVRFDNRDIGKSTWLTEERPPSILEVFNGLATGKPVTPRYTLLDMAKDTIGLLDALGIERADIVGASMGGAITHELMTAFPERLRTATTIFAPSGDPNSPPATPEAMANLMKARPTERDAFIDTYTNTWRVLNADHFPFDEEATRREGALCFDRGVNPHGVGRQMLAIVASGNRKAALRATTTPALIIHGTLDPLVPFGVGEDLAQTIPGVKFEVVEGMGHNLPRPAWPQMLAAIAAHAR
jgi:pimeloyl-ACP methyl ester carboxylesterase